MPGSESGERVGDPSQKTAVVTDNQMQSIAVISDEIQRVIDEQEDGLDSSIDFDSARCENCLKSEVELPSEVILKRCNGCGLAVYCGKECQRMAWPKHKPFCKLHRLTEGQNDKRGNRPIDTEEHDSESDGEYEKNRKYPPIHYSKECRGCSKRQKELPRGVTLKHCKSCRMVQYCGPDCQKRDWLDHKPDCEKNTAARNGQQELDYPRMYDDLIKFSETFKAELGDAGCYCLKLQMNPGDWKTHVFQGFLRYVPWRQKAANRFDVRFYGGTKISDLNEPELEQMIRCKSPTWDWYLETADETLPPLLRVVLRAGPYNAKKKSIVLLKEYMADPDLGRWNPQWEHDFVGAIKLVQAGAPRLRTSPEKLDPHYKKQPKHCAPKSDDEDSASHAIEN
ncbi:hypothetical protein DFH06DRAFT_737874 [Mycena polygramma]|nr:hypothetical protein DFH06DRAFT_737874 [Mycena polygramma]